VVQGDPPPLLAVAGLRNNWFSGLVISLEKEGDVMESLLVKDIVGEKHRVYVIDNESGLFQYLSLAACFKRLTGFQMTAGDRRARPRFLHREILFFYQPESYRSV